MGRKRTIDQSSCNKDFSCLKASAILRHVEGASSSAQGDRAPADLPRSPSPRIHHRADLLIIVTAWAATGIVTIGACSAWRRILRARAPASSTKPLAQKGGRLQPTFDSRKPDDIHASGSRE